MNWDRWEKLAPLTGVLAVVLMFVGVLLESADRPDDLVADETLSWLQDKSGRIVLGEFLIILGAVFFIWFLGTLRTRLWTAEGRTGRLSAVAYGSGLLAAAGIILQAAISASAAYNDEDLTAEAAQAVLHVSDAMFGLTEFALVPFFVAVALVTLHTRVFPVWLAWISLAEALLLAIFWIGWIGVVLVFPLWTIVVAVLLYLRPAPPPGPPPHTTGFVGTT